MARVFVIVVLSVNIIAGKNTTTDLVDAIKENLRKNNDDYVESTTVNISSLSITVTGHTKTTVDAHHSILNTGDNGLGNKEHSKNISKSLENISAATYAAQRRKFNYNHLQNGHYINKDKLILPISTRRTFQNGSVKGSEIDNRTAVDTKKYPPIQRVSVGKPIQTSPNNIQNEESAKFSKFLDSNKDLLMKFMQKSGAELQSKYETVTKPTHILRNHYRGVFDSESEVETRTPVALTMPPAANLDMSPAMGSKIYSMRLRGRLCSRSVLIPEGPKYDSQGKIYLGPYLHKRGRDYSRTRRPLVLLPRCCNCCRKSVLGCD